MKLPTNVAAADPKKVKVIKEFVHDSPLIACRFDPTGQYMSLPLRRTTRS